MGYVGGVLGRRASVAGVGGAPAWVECRCVNVGWRTKVSSVGDIGGNTRMVC